MMQEPLTTILAFLAEIGIQCEDPPKAVGFLKGVLIQSGQLLYDPADDSVECNLLHEAGHLAVTPAPFRHLVQADIESLAPHYDAWFDSHPNAFNWPEDPLGRAILQAGEAEAIAWSYAACVHLDLDLIECFEKGFDDFHHKDGWLSPALEAGQHFGITGLAHAGMTDPPGRVLVPATEFSFPKMRRWLQI